MGSQTQVFLLNQASQFPAPASDVTTAITDVSPLPDCSIPSGFLQPGMVLRITAVGAFVCSSGATNITVQLIWGTTGGVSLFTTGAVTLTASAGNNWRIDSIIRVLSVSGAAVLVAVDTLQQGISTTANAGLSVLTRTASVSLTAACTQANNLILTCTQAVALTSFTVDTLLIETLN
jgi:hypothetical protein